jgi:hypothetical protein
MSAMENEIHTLSQCILEHETWKEKSMREVKRLVAYREAGDESVASLRKSLEEESEQTEKMRASLNVYKAEREKSKSSMAMIQRYFKYKNNTFLNIAI